ncbi:MAG: AMP-binding protein [Proteobacteria bacterium]|nr:AMP-binding protein [Pseudomonadota bacterium]
MSPNVSTLAPDWPLLAGSRSLDLPAVVGDAAPWTWRDIHLASVDFAASLGAAAVCNLCTSRVAFLVTCLAALRHRALLILPPSRGQGDLAAVLQASDRPVLVVDDVEHVPGRWGDDVATRLCHPERRVGRAERSDLAWQPAWDDTAVMLYTSGSTGTPVAQPKTLRHLAQGALALGARLSDDVDGGLAAVERIVCSVPHQHMFGFESSVMLSLVHAIPVYARRPLLPADVQEAFADGPPGAWVATPLHLRSLAQAGDRIAHCNVVIASTMPLTAPLAQQTEELVAAPVLEIYGSTETGVLGMRRTAADTSWRPVGDVQLESTADATLATGSHFASPVVLPDRLDIAPDGRFTLLGRQSDLIKIGGRRASLAGLNLLLQDLPGLQDGVFHLPDSDRAVERLCLIHSGPAPDRAAMDAWLRTRIDPVFLPRTLIQVDRLPRSDTGKLQRRELDRIYAEWQAAGRAAALGFEFVIAADHPALAGHFPGRPIVPGVLLLDRVITGWSRSAAQVAIESLAWVKFSSPLLPGETAGVAFESDGRSVRFRVTARRNDAVVLLASGQATLTGPDRPRR